ncbi:hypothetical protein DTO212C5_1218 [Paecilomyces variotii]|nr:hypothetical protein DTO212C5_1218 [Paecilomyces variotii]
MRSVHKKLSHNSGNRVNRIPRELLSSRTMHRDTGNTRLTKELLEEQEALFRSNQGNDHSWVDKVINDERVCLFHSQLGMAMSHYQDPSSRAANETGALAHRKDEGQSSDALKLFRPRQELFQESPLERFLAPDGCSDPSYFARPALAEMGIPFGSSETIEVRKRAAKENAERVAKMAKHTSEK